MDITTATPISGRGSAQQAARLDAATKQRRLVSEARERNARRAAAGVLPYGERVTEELLTERLAILTETTKFPALLAEDHGSLLVDVADESGANGARTFTVKVREVDPPEGHAPATVQALVALIAQAKRRGHADRDLAIALLDAGVTL